MVDVLVDMAPTTFVVGSYDFFLRGNLETYTYNRRELVSSKFI